MELREFIVPTVVGPKGNEVADRIYLPSYEELISKYNFAQDDFVIKQELQEENTSLNDYWLRNDELAKTNPLQS